MKTRTAVTTGLLSLLGAGAAHAATTAPSSPSGTAMPEQPIGYQVKAEMQSDLTTISSQESPLVVQRDLSGHEVGAALQYPLTDRLSVTLEGNSGARTGFATINGETFGVQDDKTTSFGGDFDANMGDRVKFGLKGYVDYETRTWTFPRTADTDDLNLRGYGIDAHTNFLFGQPQPDISLSLHGAKQVIGQDPRNIYEAIARSNLGAEIAKLFAVPKTNGIAARVGAEFQRETYKAENNTQSKTIDVDHTAVTAGVGTNPTTPIWLGDGENRLGLSANVKGRYGLGRNGGIGGEASLAFNWKDVQFEATAAYLQQRSQLQNTLNERSNFRPGIRVTYSR